MNLMLDVASISESEAMGLLERSGVDVEKLFSFSVPETNISGVACAREVVDLFQLQPQRFAAWCHENTETLIPLGTATGRLVNERRVIERTRYFSARSLLYVIVHNRRQSDLADTLSTDVEAHFLLLEAEREHAAQEQWQKATKNQESPHSKRRHLRSRVSNDTKTRILERENDTIKLLGYRPDQMWYGRPAHPGDVIKSKFLNKKARFTQKILADASGCPYAKINMLVNKRIGVSPSFAIELSRSLGTSPTYWLDIQRDFDLWMVLQGKRISKKRDTEIQEKKSSIIQQSAKKKKKPVKKGRGRQKGEPSTYKQASDSLLLSLLRMSMSGMERPSLRKLAKVLGLSRSTLGSKIERLRVQGMLTDRELKQLGGLDIGKDQPEAGETRTA